MRRPWMFAFAIALAAFSGGLFAITLLLGHPAPVWIATNTVLFLTNLTLAALWWRHR